jgi:hypothetical protein
MKKEVTRLVHKEEVKPGDAIRLNGKVRTVCRSDFTRSDFMRLSIFGDSFRLGYQKVELVEFVEVTE